MKRTRVSLTASAVLLLASGAWASASVGWSASTVGWSPALTLWGEGDAGEAVSALRRLAHASDAMVNHTRLEVRGAAFGFVPTRLIDAFIPGNIEGLATRFFEVAAAGNQGRGIAMGAALGSAGSGGDAVLEAYGELEALDNRLVKMGAGMVNDRVIPTSEAIADAKKLLTDCTLRFSTSRASKRSSAAEVRAPCSARLAGILSATNAALRRSASAS